MHGLCEAYGTLPEHGGLMDQPVWLLRMRGILAPPTVHGMPMADASPGVPDMAEIPMVTLG